MAGLTVQNFVSAAVGMAVVVALIRGHHQPHAARASATSGRTLSATLFYILLPLSIVVAVLLVSRACSRPSATPSTPTTRRGRRPARWPSAPWPRRSRSSSSGPTAAASSTSTRPCRSRTPTRVHELRRAAVDHPHPGRAHLHVRAHGRPPAPGLGDLRGDARPVPRLHRRDLPGRAARHRRPAHGRPAHHASTGPPAATSRARSQRNGIAAVRRCGPPPRPSPPTARSTPRWTRYTGLGGAVPMSGAGHQRGDLRRRRHRPVLDARLRPPRGVHRRAHGGPDARVPGQEDRGARDQARLARRRCSRRWRSWSRPRWPSRRSSASRRSSRAGPRASPRPCTPTCRRPTTTARRSRATPASSSPMRRATAGRSASPSPTCSAA